MDSNARQFAVRVAMTSDTLARMHREAVERNAQSQLQHGEATCSVSTSASALAREKQVLKLAERLAAAAETIAQTQKRAALKKIQSPTKIKGCSLYSSPTSAVTMSAVVAKNVRKVADQQALRSSIPTALEVEIWGPDWAQRLFQDRAENRRQSDDDPACVTSDRYDLVLTCPISAERLKVPVRGQHCKHVECFDLESLRHSVPKGWRCPIVGCEVSVAPAELRRDSFMDALLQHTDALQCTIKLSPTFLNAKAHCKEPGLIPDRAGVLVKLACSRNIRCSTPIRASPAKLRKTEVVGQQAKTVPMELSDSDCEQQPRRKSSKNAQFPLVGA